MSQEKVMCGYVEVKDFSWGEKITISLKASELELLKKYMTGGNERYEDSVKLQLLESKSGKLYSSVDTYFYDKANGGTSGSGTRPNAPRIAEPAPPKDDLPF